MTNPRLIVTAALGLIVGAAVGYKYAEKKLMTEFEERLERETNQLRRMYKPDYETPQEMVQDLHGVITTSIDDVPDDLLTKYAGVGPEPTAYHKIRTSGVQVVKDDAGEEVITRRVFEPADDRGEIYVISVLEHTENEPGYEQATWTYYAKDGVVTDIHEDRIEDYEKFLGTDFVNKFGEISADENVVHIRNEVIMMDYEIVRSRGSYREEVLGEEMPPERPSQRIQRGG